MTRKGYVFQVKTITFFGSNRDFSSFIKIDSKAYDIYLIKCPLSFCLLVGLFFFQYWCVLFNFLFQVERLLELHFKYLDKVRLIDTEIEQEKQRLKRRGEDMDEDLEDEFYIRRLDAGLFTLQLVDYVMLEISATGASTVRHS